MHSLANAGDLAAIRDRLSSLQSGDAGQWGVMNASQMVCHVRGAFQTAMGEIAADPASTPIPAAMLKAIALWAPIPWKHNFETVPALKVGAPAMQITHFEQDRSDALGAMERFRQPEQRRGDHAFFGEMSYKDWMRWGFLHTDHHLRQFGR